MGVNSCFPSNFTLLEIQQVDWRSGILVGLFAKSLSVSLYVLGRNQ